MIDINGEPFGVPIIKSLKLSTFQLVQREVGFGILQIPTEKENKNSRKAVIRYKIRS